MPFFAKHHHFLPLGFLPSPPPPPALSSPPSWQDIDAAHLWYLRSMPGPTLLVTATASTLFEALAGRPSVHVIDVGFMLGAYMPILLQRLANQPGVYNKLSIMFLERL